MIDEKLTHELLNAIETHCNNQISALNPEKGGWEAYDHGTYKGVKIMIERLRVAINSGELDPREINKRHTGPALAVTGKDRKVFIMEGEEEEQHAASKS